MGRISQAFKRSGQLNARHEAPSTSPDAIFSAYAPEPHVESDSSREVERQTMRSLGSTRPVLAALPTPVAPYQAPSPWSSATPPAPAPATAASAATAATTETDIDRLLDPTRIGNYLGFVARSVGRRWLMTSFITVVMTGAITAAALVWPKSYHVDAKLLVQRNDVMASLVNPGRTIAREAEEPTRAAEEIVHQHENLLSVIKQTDLMNRWELTRAPLLKNRDRIMASLRGPRSDADRLDGMVGLLEQRVKVYATPEGSVTFDLMWPEPQAGFDILDHVIQNFLQFRRVSETSAISDSIAILDESVQTLEAQVTQTIAELPKRPAPRVRRSDPAPATPAVATSQIPTVPAGPPPDITRRLTRLRADLDAKRQEVAKLDDTHRLQLAEAQSRLTAAKMVYGDDFPAVIALRQTVAQLSRESPDLVNLRRDVLGLEQEYDSLTTAVQTADDAAQRAAGVAVTPADSARTRIQSAPFEVDLSGVSGAESNDPTSLRLKVELSELAAVRERANAARAELSSSQAGFKYQYKIIRPPQVPRAPSSPNIPLWVGAGAFASLLLAVFAAVAADLASGRILEPWQVEHQLGIPVAVKLQER